MKVKESENDKSLKERYAGSTDSKYGIQDFPLNSLVSFHVLIGLPPDLMHNYFEGSLGRNARNLVK